MCPELCIAIPSTLRVEEIYEISKSRLTLTSKLSITLKSVGLIQKLNAKHILNRKRKNQEFSQIDRKRIEDLQKTVDEAQKDHKDLETARNLLGNVKKSTKKLIKKVK